MHNAYLRSTPTVMLLLNLTYKSSPDYAYYHLPFRTLHCGHE
jgi:hypothetical protein